MYPKVDFEASRMAEMAMRGSKLVMKGINSGKDQMANQINTQDQRVVTVSDVESR